MPGFASSVSNNIECVFANNADFSGSSEPSDLNGLQTDGQLWIGSTALNAGSTHINVGKITSSSLTVGYSSPNITIETAGGGAPIETLTPNSGGAVSAVSGNIDTKGLSSNAGANAFPIFSYNGGAGKVDIENRTYLSSYVVDPSVINGSKGTFATLAAAITQAIADGATGLPGVSIYVRNVTINEVITVSTDGVNITIIGTGGKSSYTSNINGNPLFTGSFTNSGTGKIIFSNIDFGAASTITNSSTGLIYINNCSCDGSIVCSNGGINANNTSFGIHTITLSGGVITIYNSFIGGSAITLSNAASLAMYFTNFGGSLAGITSSTISLNFCYINLSSNTMTGGTLINFNSTFSAFDYYANTNVAYNMANTTEGNTLQAVRSAVDYVVLTNADYYVGITDTSALRTVTLPSTNIIKNQCYIIKDESGAAGTNNISVVVAGGVKTIDGVTTYAINNNFGSIKVMYDGTNYFVI